MTDRPARPDLRLLADRLPAGALTRFAPSPTGHLHLGHVVNAVYVWGVGRALGGRVLLRVEDHDRGRCRLEFERSILDDLDWLGLVPDIGPTATFRAGPTGLRQSDSAPRYEEALGRLRASAHVYACECSRRAIASSVPAEVGSEPRYPGRCRTRNLPETPGRGLRVQLEPGRVEFDDGRLGPQAQDPSRQCGDLLVRDRHGSWTYQFAVTVDDLDHGVDLVIRGEDLLDSTGRQIRLAHALGRSTPPVFLHHPLLRKTTGEKLSKSSGDTGVRELRHAGVLAEDVLGRAAWRAGLTSEPRPVSAGDLPALFDAGAGRDRPGSPG